MRSLLKFVAFAFTASVILGSCSGGGERSSATGWKYNDEKYGGFEKLEYEGQQTGPNLVLIEGGTFTMGLTDQDVTYEWNNIPRRVTVSSFYMDETEVSNINYREYLYWLGKKYISYPEVRQGALPDSLVWREELAFNEPMVQTYFRHPSYDDYPVVGVNWVQANDYCKWRSSMVPVKFEDGILLPDYILPTEAQWEYAALALQGNQAPTGDELITERRLYPWNGTTARYKKRDKSQGRILANFKKRGGDYMGMAGALNDNAAMPGPVKSYLPNDFGLYNMAGNVNEWTADVYRPLTSTTLSDVENHDLNPYRGNRFEEKLIDEEGKAVEKDSLGYLKYRYVEDEEACAMIRVGGASGNEDAGGNQFKGTKSKVKRRYK